MKHDVGEAAVPSNPQRLIAFDESAGIAALTAGIKPAVVYASAGDAGAAKIFQSEGVEVRKIAAVELPSIEEIKGLNPDLMIGAGAEGPVGKRFKMLNDIAPTLVVPITGSWRDLAKKVGEFFGTQERTDKQIAAVDGLLKKAASKASGRSISLLGNTFGTTSFTMPPKAPSSTLIADSGFTRPAFQQRDAAGYSVILSPEQLPEQSADFLVMPDGGHYTVDALLATPTAKALKGKQVRPLGEAWFVSTPFSFYVVARDLDAIAAGQDVTSQDRLLDVWKEFVDAAGS